MSCKKCQQKNPCTTTNDCACEVYLTSDCINNVKTVFECLNISNGLSLTETLQAMDEQICIKLDTITNYFTIINVGTGEEIYKGVNNLGQKELKTIVKEGDLVTVSSDENTIIIGLDEEALNTFIEANQKLTVVANAGDDGEPLVKTAVVSEDTTTYFIKRLIHSAQEGDGESVVRDLQSNTDDITLRTKKINSSTLTITSNEDDTEVLIEVPSEFTGTDYYVNINYTGTKELGTPSKPFKSLERCLDRILNRGIENNPLINGGNPWNKWDSRALDGDAIRIVIQSFCRANENLAITNVEYFLERAESTIYVPETDSSGSLEYVIDMKELVDNVPKISGQLPYNIKTSITGSGSVTFSELHTNRKGFFRGQGYNNGSLTTEQPDCELFIGSKDGSINCSLSPNPNDTFIPVVNDLARDRFVYNVSNVFTASQPIVGGVFKVHLNNVELSSGTDYTVSGNNITVTTSLTSGDIVIIHYRITPVQFERDGVLMNALQVNSTPTYGAIETSGKNAIFRDSIFLNGEIVLSYVEQHGVHLKDGGTVFGDNGRLFFKRNYQQVLYSTISDVILNNNEIFYRHIYLPCKFVYDIYLKNDASMVYSGQIYTQENTAASSGGADSFICVENSTTNVANKSDIQLTGGGIVYNLLYNHYIKYIHNPALGDLEGNNVLLENIRIPSQVFEELVYVVDTSNNIWNKLSVITLKDCTLFDYLDSIKKPFSNLAINTKLIFGGTLTNLARTIFYPQIPEYSNNSSALSAGLDKGSFYKDSSGNIKIVI